MFSRMKRIEAKAGERSSPLRDMIVFFTVVKHKKERRPRHSAVKTMIKNGSAWKPTPTKYI